MQYTFSSGVPNRSVLPSFWRRDGGVPLESGVAMRVAMLLFGVAQALGALSSAPPLRQLHTGDHLRRCCAPRAAVSEAEEAASLEAFAVEARAEDAAARSPSAVALCREAAEAEVAQLQASGDAQLVQLLEASRVVSGGDTVASGDVP